MGWALRGEDRFFVDWFVEVSADWPPHVVIGDLYDKYCKQVRQGTSVPNNVFAKKFKAVFGTGDREKRTLAQGAETPGWWYKMPLWAAAKASLEAALKITVDVEEGLPFPPRPQNG